MEVDKKIPSGFGSKLVGNECKEASSSVHFKSKTTPTSQSNDMP
jgi:hypothetical protein